MAFEYILTYPCEAKREKGVKGVLEMSKEIALVEMVENHIRRENGVVNDTDTYRRKVVTEDGEEFIEVTVGELKEAIKPSLAFKSLCKGCKANVMEMTFGKERVFGCNGSVRYPISVIVEVLIMQALNWIAEKRLYEREGWFVQYLLEHPDATKVTAMRKQSGRYFERPTPMEETVHANEGDKKVTSNQVFELLMPVKVDPEFADKVYLPFFNVFEKYVNYVIKEDAMYSADHCLEDFRAYGNAFRVAVNVDSKIECMR